MITLTRKKTSEGSTQKRISIRFVGLFTFFFPSDCWELSTFLYWLASCEIHTLPLSAETSCLWKKYKRWKRTFRAQHQLTFPITIISPNFVWLWVHLRRVFGATVDLSFWLPSARTTTWCHQRSSASRRFFIRIYRVSWLWRCEIFANKFWFNLSCNFSYRRRLSLPAPTELNWWNGMAANTKTQRRRVRHQLTVHRSVWFRWSAQHWARRRVCEKQWISQTEDSWFYAAACEEIAG